MFIKISTNVKNTSVRIKKSFNIDLRVIDNDPNVLIFLRILKNMTKNKY